MRKVWLLLLASVAGCASPALQEACPAPSAAIGDGYRLGRGDEIQLTVFRQDDLSGPYVIDQTGAIFLPLVGRIEAAGKTAGELADTISSEFVNNGFLIDPKIHASIGTWAHVSTLGEVQHPTRLTYVMELSVSEAISESQGFSERADKDEIVVRRGGCEFVASMSTMLYPGDVVVVTERFF